MALNGSNVLLFVPPAPEVLTEIKIIIFIAFYPLILRLKLSLMPLQIRFTMTRVPHCIIFQIRKENLFTGQKS